MRQCDPVSGPLNEREEATPDLYPGDGVCRKGAEGPTLSGTTWLHLVLRLLQSLKGAQCDLTQSTTMWTAVRDGAIPYVMVEVMPTFPVAKALYPGFNLGS